TITAFDAGGGDIAVDYEILNRTTRSIRAGLMLAARPYQVNPPAQFLNLAGGTARIRKIERHGTQINGTLVVNDRQMFIGHGELIAAPYESGDVVADWLRTGRLPATSAAYDTFEAASGLVNIDELTLSPGSMSMFRLTIPFKDGSTPHRSDDLGKTIEKWRRILHVPRIEVPTAGQPLIESMNAQLGYILVNRAGPAIQPGSRAYARSWIRDGSLTSSALLRLGHFKEVADFIKWFAPHQFENGKIPCVVDKRGADPVPEHDSSGEFIFLVAEYLRYTGDRSLAREMWPRVERAAVYLDTLRQERRTDAWRAPDKAEFFGLLPPSISHEGYSAKPMHSYWDDSFAYRGFKDAAWLAGQLGKKREAANWDVVAAEFGRDLGNSVAAARRRHGIAYIPGCADLGDFDATSTTIFLSPTGASTVVTPDELTATFDKYETFFTERAAGAPWEAFTPYEIRNIGAFVRLDRRDRALAMAEWSLGTQQPEGWRQWPEVVWHPGTPQKFIGDLPHTWVGSDFIRSVLDMFVYVREDDQALVVGAGIPTAWLDDPGGV
ncbi:MAG TPA: coagulation factor 5/8 type domain-containing protein, partial [Candidatus Eisenbacteria bacterium]